MRFRVGIRRLKRRCEDEHRTRKEAALAERLLTREGRLSHRGKAPAPRIRAAFTDLDQARHEVLDPSILGHGQRVAAGGAVHADQQAPAHRAATIHLGPFLFKFVQLRLAWSERLTAGGPRYLAGWRKHRGMSGSGSNFRTELSAMQTAAQHVFDVNAQIQSQLSSLQSRLDPLMGNWQGSAATSFQALKERWPQDATQLHAALRPITHGLA